jgi:hypothetical protein
MNSLVLTYTPGVCVFPARSGFTPGWVYVHVGGGAVCLISPILGTCIVAVCFVLHCTGRPHSQNTSNFVHLVMYRGNKHGKHFHV